MASRFEQNLPLAKGKKAPRFFYGYVIVLATFAIGMISWGSSMTFGIFFKPLSSEFGWTRAATSAAPMTSSILQGFLGVLMGRLCDRFGPRVVTTIGGSALGLGLLLMSQVSSIWQLYLFWGFITPISLSTVNVTAVPTIARWFVKKRGQMTGFYSTGAGVGGMTIAPLAGWLISLYGWRSAYLILGVIALAVVIIAGQFLRRDPEQVGLRPHGGQEKGKPSSLPSSAFSLGEALHTRQFWMLWLFVFSFGFTRSAAMLHMVPRVTDLGFALTTGASIVAVYNAVSILSRIVMGSAADRIGARWAAGISFALMPIAYFWLLAARDLWTFYLFAIIFGFAWGGLAVTRFSLTSELFGLGSLGAVVGASEAGGTIGAATGQFLAGYVFDVTGSYRAAFMLGAAIGALGFAMTLLLRPAKKQAEPLDSKR